MSKLDLTKLYKSYYTARTKPELADLDAAHYLAITGKGDPSSESFLKSIEALYSVAYTVKFACKDAGNDFVVARLEGQWWYDEARYGGISMSDTPTAVPRNEWEYRLLLRMPEFVSADHLAVAIDKVVAKKANDDAKKVELYTLPARRVVQMMHIGPFDTEPETLQQIISFMNEHGFAKNGLHHEVYLSDFRKTAPEKLKTILREPI
ncbi:MAG: GyrI-like domain-containing protein [Bacteroidota bacterium]